MPQLSTKNGKMATDLRLRPGTEIWAQNYRTVNMWPVGRGMGALKTLNFRDF